MDPVADRALLIAERSLGRCRPAGSRRWTRRTRRRTTSRTWATRRVGAPARRRIPRAVPHAQGAGPPFDPPPDERERPPDVARRGDRAPRILPMRMTTARPRRRLSGYKVGVPSTVCTTTITQSATEQRHGRRQRRTSHTAPTTTARPTRGRCSTPAHPRCPNTSTSSIDSRAAKKKRTCSGRIFAAEAARKIGRRVLGRQPAAVAGPRLPPRHAGPSRTPTRSRARRRPRSPPSSRTPPRQLGRARRAASRARACALAFLLAFTFALDCWDLPTWRAGTRDIIKPATEARAPAPVRGAGRGRAAHAPGDGVHVALLGRGVGRPRDGGVRGRATRPRRVDRRVCGARARRERESRGGKGAAPAACDPRSLSRPLPRAGAPMAGQRRRPRFPRRDPRLHGARGRGARHRGQADGRVVRGRTTTRSRHFSRARRAPPRRSLFARPPVVRRRAARGAGGWHPGRHPRRQGRTRRAGDAVKFDTEGAGKRMLSSLRRIDVERAEARCAPTTIARWTRVRNGEGVETVNKRVAGAVIGGASAARQKDLAVDAAACGEPEALRALPRDRVYDALRTRGGGRARTRRWRSWSRAASSTWRRITSRCTARRRAGTARSWRRPSPRARTSTWWGTRGHAAVHGAAARSCGHQVVAALIAAGATVDLASEGATGPRRCPSRRSGHHEVVTALIAAGANVDQADNERDTPLSIGGAKGHFEVVRVLREHGASVHQAACDWRICAVFCGCCWLPYCSSRATDAQPLLGDPGRRRLRRPARPVDQDRRARDGVMTGERQAHGARAVKGTSEGEAPLELQRRTKTRTRHHRSASARGRRPAAVESDVNDWARVNRYLITLPYAISATRL